MLSRDAQEHWRMGGYQPPEEFIPFAPAGVEDVNKLVLTSSQTGPQFYVGKNHFKAGISLEVSGYAIVRLLY